ncbi:hypothetical protein AGABI2DRAFT_143050 [Agaricus bisporus var. bisporus H97]|uniref:hypothetical protein n=1 Tax=Agaricus bisporus var. bisporus (strain H97 / ATCC MYA-4626 / FGSC 10389) TaxID=936046 RepID=UPI00029F60D8|nr:hypothetical protein AGABI2DRAFT_143050 [Agaricus bisporus var. bisporus H97]EKV47341.1 hypothetical protein AGABI2DRAFT_143050 [Agaricus bisporus var. bisporus H97]
MASTGGSAPPIFADAVKFNGTNWVTWKGLVKIAAELRGVFGYLDGLTVNPAANVVIPSLQIIPPSPTTNDAATVAPPVLTSTETPWESTTPSPSEWKVRNAWAMLRPETFYARNEPRYGRTYSIHE